MNYRMIKAIVLGTCLLTSMSAEAQQFETEPLLSSDEATYWYRICNAAEGMQDYAMTDCSDADVDYVIQLRQTETTNEKSQWKLTEVASGKVIVTNRTTGKQIDNASHEVLNHNATCLTTAGSDGFTITSLGDNAFTLEGEERDGINRCLAMTEREGESVSYPTAGLSASAIGWKFIMAEAILTGIGANPAARAVIRVDNKRVSVSGCPDWQLFNAQGEEMPRTATLATGVYLVKTPGRVVKVAVP